MKELKDLDLRGWVVVEHRLDSEPVRGEVEFNDVNTDGAFVIGWSHGASNRTTNFYPSSWDRKIEDGEIRLERCGADSIIVDAPWGICNLYTITRP